MTNNNFYITKFHGFQPRKNQVSAIEACEKNDCGIITDTCGSGKSYIQFELALRTLFDEDKKVVAIGAPRLNLLAQLAKDFEKAKDSYDNLQLIQISSGKNENIFNTTISATNRKSIQQIFLGNMKTVIFYCYDSEENLYNNLIGSKYKIDLLMCDEAHWAMQYAKMNENNENRKNVRKSDFDRFSWWHEKLASKMFLFTATAYKSMLDEMPEIHTYFYGQSVDDGINLPVDIEFHHAEDKEMYDLASNKYKVMKKFYDNLKYKQKVMLVCGSSIDTNKEMLDFTVAEKMKNTIVYNISSAKEVVEVEGYERWDENGIKTSYKYRQDILDKKFGKLYEDIFNGYNVIIFHVQMIGIGTDIKPVNAVFISSQKSEADLYQSVMRGCRTWTNPKTNEAKEKFTTGFYLYGSYQKSAEQIMRQLTDFGGIEFLDNAHISGNNGSSTIPADADDVTPEVSLNKIIDDVNLDIKITYLQCLKNNWLKHYEQIEKKFGDRDAVQKALETFLTDRINEGDPEACIIAEKRAKSSL